MNRLNRMIPFFIMSTKRISMSLALAVLLPAVSGAQQADALYRDTRLPPAKRVKDLIQRMTLDEKIAYLGGTGMTRGVIGETQPLDQYGIPAFKMTDSTLGAKLTKGATLFPSYIGLAASFNPALAADYGQAVAEQCHADGYRILLGPGINIYRVPHCGRNFEYLGEDPYLISRLVVPYIQAVQDAGVIATVKNFVANNSEYFRKNSNTVVDERTLREIYYPGFKAAIQEGDVKAVMSAYNLVNGKWTGESKPLLTGILRDEWGFKGMIMSDWRSLFNAKEAATSGLDLEMDAASRLSMENIKKFLDDGTLSEADIDRHVTNILLPCFEMGLADTTDPSNPELRKNWSAHAETARRIAREGLVLLKNDGLLPLDRKRVSKIAVIGGNASQTVACGGGAAGFRPGADFITILDAIRKSASTAIQVDHMLIPGPEVADADVAIVCVNVHEAESHDRNFALPPDQAKLIHETAKLNSNLLVVVSSGGAVEMPSWLKKAKAVFYAWYPGTYGSTAIGEAIFGEINPSGKLPISIEKREEDAHYWGNYIKNMKQLPYKGKGRSNKMAGVRYHDIVYREGIFVGYRWYDKKKKEPLFPFGFGLSYTTFSMSEFKLSSREMTQGDSIDVTLKLTNTGTRAGAEVVQLYIRDKVCTVPRPLKELKGFSRVNLAPNESKKVSLTVDSKALAFWHPERKAWTVEPGEFDVLIGSSSRDLKTAGTITFKQ